LAASLALAWRGGPRAQLAQALARPFVEQCPGVERETAGPEGGRAVAALVEPLRQRAGLDGDAMHLAEVARGDRPNRLMAGAS
jgi:hypothetical protein